MRKSILFRPRVLVVVSAIFVGSVAAGSWVSALTPPAEALVNACRKVVQDQGHSAFVGTIDFHFEMAGPGTGPIRQNGRLWVGPTGLSRLDIWFRQDAEPVICTISGQNAWMVFSKSPLVYAGSPNSKSCDAGFHNQLLMQARQLQIWHRTLLFGCLDNASIPSIAYPQESNGKLQFNIKIVNSELKFSETLNCVAEFVLDKADRRVTHFNSSLGYKFDALEWARVGGSYLPRSIMITSPTSDGLRTQRWTEIHAEARSTDDIEFTREFQCPTGFDSRFPSVVGICFYGPDGSETCTAW